MALMPLCLSTRRQALFCGAELSEQVVDLAGYDAQYGDDRGDVDVLVGVDSEEDLFPARFGVTVLRPMRGLRTDRTAQVIISGHAFMQNLRRGHYELGIGLQPMARVAAAFTELVQAI